MARMGRMAAGTCIGLVVIGFSRAPVVRDDANDLHETLEDVHKPRHGGSFGDADDVFHYEALLGPGGQLLLYVNDEENRPLDVRTLKGRWILYPDGPAQVSGGFAPSEDGMYFVATLPGPPAESPVPVKLEVSKNQRWVGMEFYLSQQEQRS